MLLEQPIFQLLSPTVPAPRTVQEVHRWPHHPPVGVCLHSKLYREERHWSSVSLTSRPAGYRTPLSWQKLILQLLPLAQAACDYLKPQPFIYEKREPDIRLIDGHLLKYQLVQWKEKLTFSAGIMELFLDL